MEAFQFRMYFNPISFKRNTENALNTKIYLFSLHQFIKNYQPKFVLILTHFYGKVT